MNPEPATYPDVESGAGPVDPPVTNDEPPTPWPMAASRC